MAKTRERKTQEECTWKEFSRYIRRRDCIRTTGTLTSGECFTCGGLFDYSKLQAGHIVSRSYGNALFNKDVVFAQCTTCNFKYEGNHIIGYFHLEELVGREAALGIVHKAMGGKSYHILDLAALEDEFMTMADILEDEYAALTNMSMDEYKALVKRRNNTPREEFEIAISNRRNTP